MRAKTTDGAFKRDIWEWNVPEEVLAPINHHLLTKGM